MKALSLENIAETCPAVFATAGHEKTKPSYKFYPTSSVVTAMMDSNFIPVSAKQLKTREEGRANYARHVLRFRHKDFLGSHVGEEIPEIILKNSHDGSSSYQISIGMFRLICSNGLAVCSANIVEIRVRHFGADKIIDDVINGSLEVINEAPKVFQMVECGKQTMLSTDDQLRFAEQALVLRKTPLDINPSLLIEARRAYERPVGNERDLWTTFNVVQENLIRGGINGTNQNNKTRRLGEVKSGIRDLKINRALWQLYESSLAH